VTATRDALASLTVAERMALRQAVRLLGYTLAEQPEHRPGCAGGLACDCLTGEVRRTLHVLRSMGIGPPITKAAREVQHGNTTPAD
jgi:hypothetical protein